MNMFLYQPVVFTVHEKLQRSHTKIINLKDQLRDIIKNFNYLMDHIQY